MVTLILRSGIKKFNLKNYERETALYNAWYAMHEDPKFEDKVLKIVTDLKETLELKISEILTCEINESVYVKAEVKDAKRTQDFVEELQKSQNEQEKKRIQQFLKELEKRNVTINPKDEFLHQVLDNVKSDSGMKMAFYANLYANYVRKTRV